MAVNPYRNPPTAAPVSGKAKLNLSACGACGAALDIMIKHRKTTSMISNRKRQSLSPNVH